MTESEPRPPASAAESPDVFMLIFGIGTLGAWVKIASLSRHFNIGEGWTSRPIPFVVILLLVAAALYLAAYILVRKWPTARWYLPFIIAVGLAARLVLLPSHMIQESDAYRYIWDGHVQQAEINPYRYAPQFIKDAWDYGRSVNAPEDVEQLIKDIRGEQDARTVLNWVSYPRYVTIYPPLAQLTFLTVTSVAPWSLLGMRVAFLVMDLATWFLVGLLLRRASPARFLSGILLYGWSPLVLKEVINSNHYESLTALCITATVALLVFTRSRAGRPSEQSSKKDLGILARLAASATLGLAIAAKLYPILLVPLVAAVQFRRRRRLPWLLPLVGVALTAAVTGGLYALYAEKGVELTGSLSNFMAEWERNAIIHPLTVNLINAIGTQPVNAWIPPAYQGHQAVFIASALLGTAVLILLAALTLRLVAKPVQREAFLGYAIIVVVFAFSVCHAMNPWYLVGIVPLLALQRRPYLSVLLLTGIMALRYLNFYVEYRYDLDDPECQRLLWIIRCCQFIPFYLAALIEIVYRYRGRRPVRPAAA